MPSDESSESSNHPQGGVGGGISDFYHALAQLPPYRGFVYRTFTVMPGATLPYSPGIIFYEKGFASGSKGVPIWGNVWTSIMSISGKYIAPYSQHPEEMEVVFAPGAVFKVLGVDGDRWNHNVTLLDITGEDLLPRIGRSLNSEEEEILRESREVFRAKDTIPLESKGRLYRDKQMYLLGTMPEGKLNIIAE
jgi:hypothetical protein